jgi:hypothetical protein
MSRTYRRKNQRHDYRWVLLDYARPIESQARFKLIEIRYAANSTAGRKRIAEYHSDHAFVLGQAPWHFRKSFKRSQRMEHQREIGRWVKNPEHPVQCDPRTRHSATWAWW